LLVQSLDNSSEGRTNRIAAFIGIIAFMDIPIINMSVRWWRTLHPQPIVLAPISEDRLPIEMLVVLLISTIAILLLAIWLIMINVRILKNEYTIKQILSQSFNKGARH
jgi:heme exporter protein C